MAVPSVPRSGPTADETLIARAVAGDQAAFETLYERYFSRVYAYVGRRLSNRADTEEAVQEVFINVFSSLSSFRGSSHFAAWVLGVARHTVAGRFKKKRHPTVPLAGGEEPVDVDGTQPMARREPSPLEQLECGERIEQLERDARQRLSSEQRTLFQWHHLEHRSIQEIAHTLHKSEDAVKSNLYRARKLLLAR